jgi:hypothetical protein
VKGFKTTVRLENEPLSGVNRGFETLQEHKQALPTRWLLFDRLKRDRLQRHRSAARLGLRALQAPFRERAVDIDDARLQVDVAPFERDPFGGTEPSGGRVVVKLSGDHIPAAWTSGFEIEHVREESGLLQADWTFGNLGVGSEPPEGFDFPQVFELLLWPALRKHVDLGPP